MTDMDAVQNIDAELQDFVRLETQKAQVNAQVRRKLKYLVKFYVRKQIHISHVTFFTDTRIQ